ncbi:hypothetical protein Tco_1082876 [Tanacetum coccineum]|uniref:Uncharacterized protein n=1 Tax=Tanacetum coccineum TaxID=301880 RepID=A0ABQ5I2U0_9ASTR
MSPGIGWSDMFTLHIRVQDEQYRCPKVCVDFSIVLLQLFDVSTDESICYVVLRCPMDESIWISFQLDVQAVSTPPRYLQAASSPPAISLGTSRNGRVSNVNSTCLKLHAILWELKEMQNIARLVFTFAKVQAPPCEEIIVEQDQLTDLTTYVEGVVLGVTPDRWYWTLDGSGEFSVASARKVIDDNRFPEGWKIPEFPWGSLISVGGEDGDLKRFPDGDEGEDEDESKKRE